MDSRSDKYLEIGAIILAALRLIADERNVALGAGTGGQLVVIQGYVATLLGCRLESVDVAFATSGDLPVVEVGAPFGNAEGTLDDLIGKVTELGAGEIVGQQVGATFAAIYQS